MADGTALGPEGLLRICRSLVADELGQTRHVVGDFQRLSLGWPVDQNLREDGIELDSLELQNCTARIAEFFRLFETGTEDLLLARPWLSGWVDTLLMALPHGSGLLTFQTSGSTGAPKTVHHPVDRLLRDARAIAQLAAPGRILSCVPPHHVYGAIYTAVLPALCDIPCIDTRAEAPSRVTADMRAGDLLVTTPFLLRNFLRRIERFPEGVTVLTSSAPLPCHLARAVSNAGAARLIDIYGSTETLGVGWRTDATAPYTLFSHWDCTEDGRTLIDRDGCERVATMDVIDMADERRFRVLGRRDRAVQIGGVNVHPAAVETTLNDVYGVEYAEVEAVFAPNGLDVALVARIALAQGVEPSGVERAAVQHVRERHGPLSVPRSFEWIERPEVTAMGKVVRSHRGAA